MDIQKSLGSEIKVIMVVLPLKKKGFFPPSLSFLCSLKYKKKLLANSVVTQAK